MSVPQLMVAGTSLVFIVALCVFVVTLIRARRRAVLARQRGADAWSGAASLATHQPLDTSLVGLEVPVSQDAPSAALLTPLRTGEWMPPAEPAPLRNLDAVSLAGRMAEFRTAPSVPEPRFSAEKYAPWEVASSEGAEAAALAQAVTADVAQAPSIRPVASTGVPSDITAEMDVVPEPVQPHESAEDLIEKPGSDDDFDAEIAALLPQIDLSVPPAPAPQPAPAPAPTAAPAPQPVPSAAVQALVEETLWNDLLVQQSRETPRAVAPTPSPVARPEVRVAVPPEPKAPAPQPVAPPQPVRPRVHVRVAHRDDDSAARKGVSPHAPVSAVPRMPEDRGSIDPDLAMAAPIEMWFGDSRIGVKSGTATYDRFRKYADVLLADLHHVER